MSIGCSTSTQRESAPDSADYGIPAIGWQGSFDSLEAILDGMPRRIGSLQLALDEPDVVSSDAFDLARLRFVDGSQEVLVHLMNARDPKVSPPRLTMGMLFTNMVDDRDCIRSTYRGSIEPVAEPPGSQPGMRQDQMPTSGVAWFACEVSTPGAGSNATEFSAGWIAEDVSWVLKAPTESLLQQTVDELAATFALPRGQARAFSRSLDADPA